MRSRIELRVRASARDSSHPPRANRNTTVAASEYAPIPNAPMTAIIMSTFMSTLRARTEAIARGPSRLNPIRTASRYAAADAWEDTPLSAQPTSESAPDPTTATVVRLRAIHGRETVAEALGINVPAYKVLAFVINSVLTSMAGCLFAYYRGFVSAEAFSLFLTIQYVAMIIIGGMGSILGAVLGAVFVTLFPYLIEAVMSVLPVPASWSNSLFAVNYAAFGLVMILFLVFEPQGLVGIWHRIQNYFLLWPFKQRPLAGTK